MIKVKALYHFVDNFARVNRAQGDEFEMPEDQAKALLEAGVILLLEVKPEAPEKKPRARAKSTPKKRTKKKSKGL